MKTARVLYRSGESWVSNTGERAPKMPNYLLSGTKRWNEGEIGIFDFRTLMEPGNFARVVTYAVRPWLILRHNPDNRIRTDLKTPLRFTRQVRTGQRVALCTLRSWPECQGINFAPHLFRRHFNAGWLIRFFFLGQEGQRGSVGGSWDIGYRTPEGLKLSIKVYSGGPPNFSHRCYSFWLTNHVMWLSFDWNTDWTGRRCDTKCSCSAKK